MHNNALRNINNTCKKADRATTLSLPVALIPSTVGIVCVNVHDLISQVDILRDQRFLMYEVANLRIFIN